MPLFKGHAYYTVDAKGRVAIPAKMRSVLCPEAKNTFTVTRGLDQCIALYPLDTWMAKENDIGALNNYNIENRAFVRRTMMWAEEVPMDAQGRLKIPKSLIEHAGIEVEGQALIVGVSDHVEIWNPATYKRYEEGLDADYETLAARVMSA